MKTKIVDCSQAVGEIAYKLSQVLPVYPITPSSPMAEHCSALSARGEKNLLGEDVKIIEMQSEGGVAGLLHGALSSRALSSTFSSSQGLLLMLPNMYKLVGECLPAVFHIASRAVATHALSIFCDHSDVMATRTTGIATIASNSVQEAHHMAIASHLVALSQSTPVLHFFDGFRTSHELQKISMFENSDLAPLFSELMENYKSTYKDAQYGTAQNPDTFYQNRIKNISHNNSLPQSIENAFEKINTIAGTNYQMFEYVGHKSAKHIIVCMGSACESIEEYIKENPNNKIGLIKVRVYRPFIKEKFLQSLPKTAKTITVLDRCKEDGSMPPLYLDVSSCLQKTKITLLSGVYGLGGKDFTPSDIHTIYHNMLDGQNKNNFNVGIIDDENNTHLENIPYQSKQNNFEIKIFGLGSDGSVSASKSIVKILGEEKFKNVQGYFEYDSKKSGSLTKSHLRLSCNKIQSEYLIKNSNIICINNFSFIKKYDCLDGLKYGGTVILNTIFSAKELDSVLPKKYVEKLQQANANLYILDAQSLAREYGLGSKINIIMESALLKCTGLMTKQEITKKLEAYIKTQFALKGQDVVNKNILAMKSALKSVSKVNVANLKGVNTSPCPTIEDEFYNNIMKPISMLKGDKIEVSKFSADGSVPLDTTKFEKRNIASRLPQWIKENCVQCGQCVLACPHSALRALLVETNNGDESFANAIGLKDKLYKILLSPEDCTGCGVCAKTCPAIKKALEMQGAEQILEKKIKEYNNNKNLPQTKQNLFNLNTAKGLQFEESLFKFPGACAGCGETPYIKILTMLNGSNLMIANATGCSSIYGGTFGSCPYGKDENGGIFWANSLFEDNAEFGLGISLGNTYTQNKNKKVWIVGGDGWANDIGFGGLDHILASGENINILVLDNQSYSNTGGQASKATPTGASIKLAESGKNAFKKNLGLHALQYKDVFVGQISLGGNINHAIKTLSDAQNYQGVSIVIAYAPCINQGFELSDMISHSKLAVESGFWPIYSYNPIEEKISLASGFDEEKYDEFLKGQRRFAITIEANKTHLLDKQKNQAKNDFEILKK